MSLHRGTQPKVVSRIPRVNVPSVDTARIMGAFLVWRLQSQRFRLLDAGGCDHSNGRFHVIRSGIYVLYCCLRAVDCIHEVGGTTTRNMKALPRSEAITRIANAVLPTNLWSIQVPAGLKILDLTNPETAGRIGIPAHYLVGHQDSSGDAVLREVGRQAFLLGYDGILVSSVPGDGTNLNLFLGGPGQLPKVLTTGVSYRPVDLGSVPDVSGLTPVECVIGHMRTQMGA